MIVPGGLPGPTILSTSGFTSLCPASFFGPPPPGLLKCSCTESCRLASAMPSSYFFRLQISHCSVSFCMLHSTSGAVAKFDYMFRVLRLHGEAL
jgi:hypothetical protein